MVVTSTTFEHAVEALYNLNVGVVGTGTMRHERPHKPLLLLAVIDLIAQGKATPNRIPWSQDLRTRFALYFEQVRQRDDQCTPENPFFYLRQEKWWRPLRQSSNGIVPLENTPIVRDTTAGTIFASVTEPLACWLSTPTDRLRLRDAIISRYFPHARVALSQIFIEGSVQETPRIAEPSANDAEVRPGRSSGFRRIILEIYDYQCAACGLRIRLPQIDDLTFVDAAHLIPFSDRVQGCNDHPTNGIALCKNHHWAMDRFLIAPAPDRHWQVSRLIEPRRSLGESELHSLEGKPILLPHDEAFLPAQEALAWRVKRLAA